MSKPYLPLYVGDYRSDTVALNTTEHGAYLTLLMAAWASGGELPAEREELYRLASATTAIERKAVDKVIQRYWKPSANGSEGIMNPRLSREHERATSIYEAQAQGGRSSAAKRWGNRSANSSPTSSPINEGDSSPNGSPGSSLTRSPSSSANSSPVTTRTEEKRTGPPPTPLTQDSLNPSSSASSSEHARTREGSGDDGNGGDDERKPEDKPASNGEIELTDGGEWLGVSEKQRLKWQSMFDSLSIPDELDHAAQWLLAKPEKRSEYASVEGGLQSYIVNWLLREARGKPPPPTKH